LNKKTGYGKLTIMTNKFLTFALLVAMIVTSCISTTALERPVYIPNKQNENLKYLTKEQSPYLLNYVQSKVNWYPWHAAAFKKATRENKMLLIDFGKLDCDECLDKDYNIFEKNDIAKYINDNFIAIKVDINERPDLYKFYQKAYKAHTNSDARSSITVLALADGKPFWLNANMVRPQFSRALNFFSKQYYRNSAKIEFVANELTTKIKSQSYVSVELPNLKKRKLHFIGERMVNSIDVKEGGLRSEEQSEVSSSIRFLMRHYNATNDERVLEAIELTLDKLAMSESFDHIGGGFFELNEIKTGHNFGKSLITNAQMVSLYCEAYQLTKKPLYREVVVKTLDFIQKELSHPLGAFYSGVQGRSHRTPSFYLWTQSEISKTIENELFATIISDYYNISEIGSAGKDKNLPYRVKNDEDFLKTYGLTFNELESILYVGQQKLLKKRNKRLNPKKDEQIITSSNALVLKAFTDAYRVLGNDGYLDRALRLANFLDVRLRNKNGKLAHNYNTGKHIIKGFLDDYAYTIDAFINLYQATFDEKWLLDARSMSEAAIKNFQDRKTSMFYFSDVKDNFNAIDDIPLFDIEDEYKPSSNSSIAQGVYYLGMYFEIDEYKEIAKAMMANVQKDFETTKQPTLYSNWGILYDFMVTDPFEVSIVGTDYEKLRRELDKNFLPNVLFSGGLSEGSLKPLSGKLIDGETLIYVCKNKICKMPTDRVSQALALMVSNE